MILFFYNRSKRKGKSSLNRSFLLGILSILLISIPFVDFLIWVQVEWLGFELDRKTIFLVIAPLATTITVLIVIMPVIIVWGRLFRAIDQEALKAAKAQAEAERLLKQRTEFVAYVSHEIRNPLNGIIGIVDSMDRSRLDPETAKSIDIISNSSGELMYILNDILDMSKIDEGEIQISLSRASMHKVISELFSFWEARAKEKSLNFSLTICETFPDYVMIDVQKFRQVVNNMISNAIKYSDRGSINLSADYDQANQLAQISVLDTGEGIPPTMKKKIFEPYQQVEATDKMAISKLGTGLGLPIARRLARAMGGDIVLAQSSNAGSKFTFSFKLQPVDAPAEAQISDDNLRAELKSKSVLVVDDSMANAIVIREHLHRLGLRIDIVSSGKAALKRLSEQKFDFVVIDDNLGDMRGTQVLELAPAKNPPTFIVYTARASEPEQKQYFDLGFSGFISKPALFEDVKKEFARISLSKMKEPQTTA